jgi:hypothetical protein
MINFGTYISFAVLIVFIAIVMNNPRCREAVAEFRPTPLKAMVFIGFLNGAMFLTPIHWTVGTGETIMAVTGLMKPYLGSERLQELFPFYWGINYLPRDFWNYRVWISLGMLCGSFIAAYMSNEFRVRWPKSPARVVQICIGAFLLGFGLRLGIFCNVGSFFDGVPSLVLGSMITATGIAIGAYLASILVIKRQYRGG